MKQYKIFLISVLSLLPASFKAQVTDAELLRLLAENDSYVRQLRRHFHEYPEVGGRETATVSRLKAELKKLGTFDIHDVPGSTGFYAILDTHRPGPTIGLRTDIDGLPIAESTVNGGGRQKPFLSRNANVMQGCGHDGHMAILLGAAKILSSLSDLTGRVVFIFEEGEETNTGIRPMVEALRGIPFDAIYGNHLASNVPTGKIYVREGSIMAGMAMLSFQVFGRGGHASRPDMAVNPLFATADILSTLAIAWNSQRDLTKLVTLGITQVEGGQTWNVIPDSAYVGGTLRFFDCEAGRQAVELVNSVSQRVAAAHGCTVRIGERQRVQMEPVVNDTTLALDAKRAFDRLFPGVVTDDPSYNWYASETFALYSRLAPTLFTLVGTRNDSLGTTAGHHTAAFDLDEEALHYGLGAMVAFVRDRGTGSSKRFPTRQQTTDYTCGCVSAQMVLDYYGLDPETEEVLAMKMHTHTDSDTPGAKPGSAKRLTDYGTSVIELYNYFLQRPDISIVASSYTPGETAPKPHFADYQAAGRFLQEQTREDRPVMVCWNAWGGHWTVVTDYDDAGTPGFYDDDHLTMADPYDTTDGQRDGITQVGLVQFFYDWFCVMTPEPWQQQPYIVVEPATVHKINSLGT